MKYRLFAPGPTPVSEEASLAAAVPLIHHRTKEFQEIFQEVRDGLKWLFQTQKDVLILAASGSGAMEAAVVNTLSVGDKVLVIDGGKFGERWWKICQAYGVETDILQVEWGQAVDPAAVKAKLDEGGFKAVFVQASESSTGVYHPIEELAAVVKQYSDTIFVVDGISAVGAMNLEVDKWGIDILVTGSQKAFGLPPGLAFISLSDKAWKMTESSTLPKFYFDLKRELKGQQGNSTAFTPAISLIVCLQTVLRQFKEEGLCELFMRHTRLADAMRAGVKALGLELYAAPGAAGNSLTAIKAPEGIDGQDVYKRLSGKFNMTIAGGQDQAKGKIFRFAHLGYFDELDMITALGTLEWCLVDLGYQVPQAGAGVAAALELFRKSDQ